MSAPPRPRIETNSPAYWALTVGTLLVLGGGIVVIARTFLLRIEPAARERLEERHGIQIDVGMNRTWSVSEESWETYEGNRSALASKVFVTQALILAGFVLSLLLLLVVVFLTLSKLTGTSPKG